jgi:quinol monooxygenase YgiN
MHFPGSEARCIEPCSRSRLHTQRARLLAYGAFQSVRDPDEFYIHSRWQDTAAFELHAELPHTLRFVQTVEPLLDHPFKATLSEQLW